MDINLKDISIEPGVYMFLDAKDRIIYAGKAKSLRHRLANYFNQNIKTVKTEKMLAAARALRTIVVTSEVEAFLLEMNIIKTEQPKYNVLLKDAKCYPYVKLTDEDYPRLIYTRNISEKNAVYFGPFVNAGELKEIIYFFRQAFPLRTCSDRELKKGKRCINYQIHKCHAPCENLISKEDYAGTVDEIKTFFKGETSSIENELKNKMQQASDEMKYEEAAFYRDRINAVKSLFAKQQVVRIDERSLDLFFKFELKTLVGVTQLFVRGGRLLGTKTHFFSDSEEELLERFIMQYYAHIRQFPDMILALGDDVSEELGKAVSKLADKKVVLRKRGFAELVELAEKNAAHAVDEQLLRLAASGDLLPRLSKITGVNVFRTECVDISHFSGEHTVGVSIVSEDGCFMKSDYRKYKIKTAQNNDVQAIRELFLRKMGNISEGSEPFSDLYLIDGGISQLNSAKAVIDEFKMKAACLSISKSRSKRYMKNEVSESIEEVYIFGRKNPLKFKKNDPVMLFFQKLRDEAHRFAVKYSRSLALKKRRISPLLEIEGVGELRARKILLSMPDIYERNDLSPELVHKLARVPAKAAELICIKIAEMKGS